MFFVFFVFSMYEERYGFFPLLFRNEVFFPLVNLFGFADALLVCVQTLFTFFPCWRIPTGVENPSLCEDTIDGWTGVK